MITLSWMSRSADGVRSQSPPTRPGIHNTACIAHDVSVRATSNASDYDAFKALAFSDATVTSAVATQRLYRSDVKRVLPVARTDGRLIMAALNRRAAQYAGDGMSVSSS